MKLVVRPTIWVLHRADGCWIALNAAKDARRKNAALGRGRGRAVSFNRKEPLASVCHGALLGGIRWATLGSWSYS